MNSTPSIRSRFAFTAVFSAARMGLSFLTGILIARTLGPSTYGNYMFLLGSFLGIRQLLDLGSSTAFYTFLCQRPRGAKFILTYLGWQGFQFLLALLLIGLIFPDRVVELIWVKQDRSYVLLAFLAVFLTQQVGLTITQIGESLRRTHRVQILNFLAAVITFVLMFIASRFGLLNVTLAFTISIIVAALSFVVAFRFIPVELVPEKEERSFRELFHEYVRYCSPLAFYTILTFVFSFADNWLLQHFGGSRQQGFYSIANQFSIAGLFATNAMLNIFWKETADLFQSGNRERLVSIYLKTSRFLFFSGAAVCGILSPWANEIALLSLGPTYVEGAYILAVMFVYPVHQCVNQLNSTVFYATGKTKDFVFFGSVFMVVSILVSYFVQAPPSEFIPGLGLGAIGMALKMVILNVISATITSAWLAKIFQFRFDWRHQVSAIVFCFGLGSGSSYLARAAFSGGETLARLPMLGMIGASAIFYFAVVGSLCWLFPNLLGFQKIEIQQMFTGIKAPVFKLLQRVQSTFRRDPDKK